MTAEATVDASDEYEQTMGWFNMLEEHLELPFETSVLGITVTVAKVDLRANSFVAICARGRVSQAILLADLPLPTPRPGGAEWIEAYRGWLGEG